jgi:AraC-like DNA-binding protein
VVSCALQVIELALTSLSGRLGSAPSRLDRYHQERIKSYIRENLRNPRLSPQTIATGVGLSVRHMYDLLAGESETLMRQIWKDRLRRSHDDLLATEHARRSISEIAFSWGFQDAAHFSRMFRSQFGETPSALRRSVFESRGLKSLNRRRA